MPSFSLLDRPALSPAGRLGATMENRLRVLRAERAWSQAELAERLDVSRQAVNAIETGKHDPSLELAFKIALVFGQPIEAIFNPKLPQIFGDKT